MQTANIRYKIRHRQTNKVIAAFIYKEAAKEYLDEITPGWNAFYILDSLTGKVYIESEFQSALIRRRKRRSIPMTEERLKSSRRFVESLERQLLGLYQAYM